MISLLIFILFVAAIVSLAVWAVRALAVPNPFGTILVVVACLIGLLAVGQRIGAF